MTVADTSRKAGPYTGNGETTQFPFTFKVFAKDQVSVAVNDGTEETTLTLNTDYSVSLNSDQDNSPGGTVTLTEALTSGYILAITSAVPYNQETVFTNKGGFYPAVLNDSLDKATAQIQQLSEKIERAITVDATDTMTASELKDKLLQAADSAYDVAIAYANQAGTYASQAKGYAEDAESTLESVKSEVETVGSEQKALVTAEGDTQVARVEAAADNSLVASGIGGVEVFWTLTEDVASGTEITIPNSYWYVVGRHHLQVRWNGCACFIGAQFEEVGDADAKGTTFKLLFDASTGDELDVLITPLGTGNVDEAITKVEELSDALADLSARVVYKSEESAS